MYKHHSCELDHKDCKEIADMIENSIDKQKIKDDLDTVFCICNCGECAECLLENQIKGLLGL